MTLHELKVKIGTDTSQLKKLTNEVRGVMSSVQASMRQFGTVASAALTAPLALMGKAVLKSAGDFQSGMNMVGVLTRATSEQFQALEDKAIELGRSSAFSAVQVSDAMRFMAMAGMETDEIFGALESTLNLAASAALDMGQAADIVTNIMTGFGLPVNEVEGAVDVLVTTFTRANTDLQQLGEAFKYAGPVAKAAGLSFEETSAVLGQMGKVGIQASMAGTSLRGALTRLLNPTKEINSVLNDLGVVTTDSSGNLLSMVNIIGQLEVAGASAGQLMEIFGQRAGPAFTGLVEQGAQSLQDFVDILTNDTVKAADVANATLFGFKGAMVELQSAVESLFIVIGQSGLLDFAEGLVDTITGVVRAVADFNPAILNMGVVAAAAAAAIGPLALVISFLSPTVLAVVAGVAALAGAIAALSTEGSGISGFFSTLGEQFSNLKGIVMDVAKSFMAAWERSVPFLKSAFGRLWASIVNFVQGVVQRFNMFMGFIRGFWAQWGDLITSIGMNVFNQFVDVLTTGISWILDTLEILADFLTGDFTGAWEGIKKLGMSVFQFLARTALRFADTFLSGLIQITGFLPDFNQALLNSREKIRMLMDNEVLTGVASAAEDLAESVEGATDAVTEATDEAAKKTGTDLDIILNNFSDAADELADLIPDLEKAMSAQMKLDEFMVADPVEAAQNQVDLIMQALTEAFQAGKGPGDAIVDDIIAKLEGAKEAFGEAAREAFKGVEVTAKAPDIVLDEDKLDLGPALKIEEYVLDLSKNIESGMSDAAAAFGDGLAKMAFQGGNFGDVLKGVGASILGTLADMAIKTGKMAIGTGLAIAGIKKALESLNPVAAIGAGIALVALGSFVKAGLASIAGGGSPGVPSGGGGGGSGAPVSAEEGNRVSFGLMGADPRETLLKDLMEHEERLFNMIAHALPDELVARVRSDEIYFVARKGEQRNSRVRGDNSSGVRNGR